MAFNWIKWVKGLSHRREVLAVARALNLDRRIVACACMELWEWADDNTTTGFIDSLAASDIDSLVGINGFGSALLTEGWLTVRSNGIEFPFWDRHNSQSAKQRAYDQERQVKHRHKSVTTLSQEKSDTSYLILSNQLYDCYPRKVGKAKALRAIEKALKKASFDVLHEAVVAFAKARDGEDHKYTPHPATWFNEERWNDDRSNWNTKPESKVVKISEMTEYNPYRPLP